MATTIKQDGTQVARGMDAHFETAGDDLQEHRVQVAVGLVLCQRPLEADARHSRSSRGTVLCFGICLILP